MESQTNNVRLDTQNGAGYWVYCNHYHDQIDSDANHDRSQSMVFFHFDHGSHEVFSGIRLVIVSHPRSRQEPTCLIEDWPSRSTFSQRPKEYPDRSETGETLKPVATLIFALTSRTVQPTPYSGYRYCFKLAPRPEVGCRWRTSISNTRTPVILYDRTYRIEHDRRSLVLKFMWASKSRIPSMPININYHIRVLSLSIHPSRSMAQRLSPSILSLIVENAIDCRNDPKWPRQVLDYSITSKSWRHVTSIFWKYAGSGEAFIPDLRSIVHSLRSHPQDSEHLLRFNFPLFLTDQEPEPQVIAWSYQIALAVIDPFFSLATQLTSITTCYELFLKGTKALSLLRHVRDFRLQHKDTKAQQARRWHPPLGCTLRQIFDVIQGWNSLKTLRVSSWDAPARRSLSSKKEPLQTPSFALENLYLEDGSLTKWEDLFNLIAHPETTLKSITLSAITGLASFQLMRFLYKVSPTLEQLCLDSVQYDPSSAMDWKEVSLKVWEVIEKMPNLTEAQLCLVSGSGLSTYHSISMPKKPPLIKVDG